MIKKAIINALGASGYIVLIVSVMTLISNTQSNKPDTFLAPIVFLSLLTLSVTVMGYIFFYQPVQLIILGKKKEGIELFTKTIGIFAVITLLVLGLLFSGLIK